MRIFQYGDNKVLAEVDNELRAALKGITIVHIARSDNDEIAIHGTDVYGHFHRITLMHSSEQIGVREHTIEGWPTNE